MKNIEWLKEEVNDYLDIEGVEDARMALKAVLGYINQLDEPEVLSDEWIDEHLFVLGDKYPWKEAVPVADLQSLLVPKQDEITEKQAWEVLSELYDIPNKSYIREAMQVVADYVGSDMTISELKEKFAKPVIPQFVADWVESRDYYNVYKVLQDLSAPGSPHASKDVRNWIFRNQENVEKFVRAWLDGYEVEEEQKYYARIKGWELFVDFVGAKYWGVVSNSGRLGFVSIDGAKERTKEEWNELGINEDNADFVKVEELEE